MNIDPASNFTGTVNFIVLAFCLAVSESIFLVLPRCSF
jgi:hypothetical protein